MESADKDTMNSILFLQLVATFQNAAWQQLGKRVNPITQTVERNFEQASLSIGMLDMLLAKTSGNLTEEESRFLKQAISDLKLNYVEEVNKAETGKGAEKEPAQKSAEDKQEEIKEKPEKPATSRKAVAAKRQKRKAASSRKKKEKKA
jgi:regulatory protein YycI of two-component signal transduction system YycFG